MGQLPTSRGDGHEASVGLRTQAQHQASGIMVTRGKNKFLHKVSGCTQRPLGPARDQKKKVKIKRKNKGRLIIELKMPQSNATPPHNEEDTADNAKRNVYALNFSQGS